MNARLITNPAYEQMAKNVVLDTNGLLMSVSSHSPYYPIWLAFLNGLYTLCLSNEIIEEYEEVMARNLSPHVSESIITSILLRPNIRKVDPHYSFSLIKADVDDNKFVDCAIVSHADFIVTEDKHFHELSSIPFPQVDCMGIDPFNQWCKRDKEVLS